MNTELDVLQKALDNRPSIKEESERGNYTILLAFEKWFEDFTEKFVAYKAELELPVDEWLIKNAKTLSDLLWENNLEWNEWLRMGITEAKHLALAPKYQGKWVSVDEILAYLAQILHDKIVAEEKNREYAKLVAGQAQEYAKKLENKVLVDRKQLIEIGEFMLLGQPAIFPYIETEFEKGYSKGYYDAKEQVIREIRELLLGSEGSKEKT